MNGKKKSGCFCLHLPRCWMVRYQQLALHMLVLTKKQASRDGPVRTSAPTSLGRTTQRPLLSSPLTGRRPAGLHLHTAEIALLRPTPSGPQTLRRGETLCSEAGLPLEPQEPLFLRAFAPLRPDPGDSELTANRGSKVGHLSAGPA